MPNLDDSIAATTKRPEQQLRRKAIAEYAAKEKERKGRRKAEATSRRADAHRKITLGGLVIAAGVDEWNEAEIVGALLYIVKKLDAEPDKRRLLREAGIQQLAEREATRKATRVRQ